MTSFNDWMCMYPPSFNITDGNKSKYLKKLDLLLHVFDREVSEIKKHLQNEYESLELSLAKETKADNSNPKESGNKKESASLKTSPKPILSLMRTAKDIGKKSAKDSPDIFTQNVREDEQIAISDNEMAIFSPEAFSPKLKTKKHLRLSKCRELAKHGTPATLAMPKNADNMDLDIIECTPDVKSVKHATRSSTRKKLFERPAPKYTQSLFTLPEHFKNESKKSQPTTVTITAKGTQGTQEINYLSGILKESNSNKSDNITGVKEMGKGKRIRASQVFSEVLPKEVQSEQDTTLLCTQNGYMDIDVMLERVSNDIQVDKEAEIPIVDAVMEQKKSCRICDMKGSPCRRHLVHQELKEPDQTFTGFWDMDFTVGAKGVKKSCIANTKLADESSNYSTVFM